MKKFLNAIAIMMACVMVAEVPVSAANYSAVNTGSVVVMDGEDKAVVLADQGTTDANDGTTDANDGTTDANDGTTDASDSTNDGNDSTTDGVDGETAPQVIGVVINGSKTYDVVVGDAPIELEATVITNKDVKYDVNWSADSDAVTVEQDGNKAVITAVKGGKATVTVNAGGKKDSVVINVKQYTTEMSFAQESYTWYLKQKVNFAKEIIKNGNDKVTYSVSDKKIATVDKNGVVTMKKVGTVVLRAASEHGVAATTTITVEKGNPVTKLHIEKKSAAGKVSKLALDDIGKTETLKVVVDATQDKTDKHTDFFEWSSAKPGIVSVVENEDGTATIEAVGVGSAKITVKAASGKKATVTVTANAALKSLKIVNVDNGETSATVHVKKKITLNAIKDHELNKDKLTWTSSNTKVAKVSSKGVVSAVKEGNATITVTSKKTPSVSAKFEVSVVPSPVTDIEATKAPATMWVGEGYQFTAKLSGEGTAAEDITWSTSSKKIMTIDANGNATAIKAGKATIKATVTLSNGKPKTISYKVKVQQPVTGLSMKKAVQFANAGAKKSVSFSAVKAPVKNAVGDVAYEIVSITNNDVDVTKDRSGVTVDAKKGKVAIAKNVTKNGDVITVKASTKTPGGQVITTYGQVKVVKGANKITFNVNAKDVTSVKKSTVTVEEGKVFNLNATGSNDPYDKISYSVNKDGVSVDELGNVYALHAGSKVKVTAQSESGKKASITVTVIKSSSTDEGTHGGEDGTHPGEDATGDGNDATGDGNDATNDGNDVK